MQSMNTSRNSQKYAKIEAKRKRRYVSFHVYIYLYTAVCLFSYRLSQHILVKFRHVFSLSRLKRKRMQLWSRSMAFVSWMDIKKRLATLG